MCVRERERERETERLRRLKIKFGEQGKVETVNEREDIARGRYNK